MRIGITNQTRSKGIETTTFASFAKILLVTNQTRSKGIETFALVLSYLALSPRYKPDPFQGEEER